MKEVMIDSNGFIWLCHTQNKLLAHVNIIMKQTIYNRHDALHMLEQIDFECFLIVICDNTAAFPCKHYC